MMPKRELLLYLTCLVELIINIFYNWSKNLGIWSFNYRKSQINENFKLTKISKFNINLHSIRIESTFLLVTLPINIDPSRLYNYLKIRNKIRLYFLKWSRLQLWVGILDRTELYRSLAFFVYRFDRSAFKTEIYPHIFNKLFIVLQQIFTTCATQCTSGTYTMGGETATIKCCNTNKCSNAQTVFRLSGSLQPSANKLCGASFYLYTILAKDWF